MLEENSPIEFTLINELGQVVQVVQKDNLESGNHQFNIATTTFPTGIYFYNLKCDNKTSSGKILIQH